MTQYAPQRRTRTNKHGRVVTETFYPLVCACGRVRYLRAKDLKPERECYLCSQKRKAVKGLRALEKSKSKKYGGAKGAALLVLISQATGRERISASERVYREMLKGVSFEHNAIIEITRPNGSIQRWIVDFLIAKKLVIEINGGCHVLHAARDSAKTCDLLNAGYAVAGIEDDDLSPEWILRLLT